MVSKSCRCWSVLFALAGAMSGLAVEPCFGDVSTPVLAYLSAVDRAETPQAGEATDAAAQAKDAEETVTDAAANKGKKETAVLRVTVTGAGRPVDEAEVKVKVIPTSGTGQTFTRFTEDDGNAVFTSQVLGRATVRVIAKGWESALKEVNLKAGPQDVKINLKALP